MLHVCLGIRQNLWPIFIDLIRRKQIILATLSWGLCTHLAGVSVDSHGLSVSRQQQQQSGAAGVSGGTQRSSDQDAAAASPPVPSTLDHEVWDESSTAVLVPVDTRWGIASVCGCHWQLQR